MTYGERFKALRHKHWKGKLLELAQRLGSGYPSSVTNIERSWRVPNVTTIAKHAHALGVSPWELLDGVETEYDVIRKLAQLPSRIAEHRWEELLGRYKGSIERTAGSSRGRAIKSKRASPGERARSTA